SDAEIDVAGVAGRFPGALLGLAGLDEGNLIARGVEHQDSRPAGPAGGEVDSAQRVNGHAVAPLFVAEVDQRTPGAAYESVGAEGKCIDFHRGQLGFWSFGIDAIGAVIVIGDVERLLVRANGDAVGLLDVVGDLDDRPVGVDTVDRAVFELTRLGAQVPRIRE